MLPANPQSDWWSRRSSKEIMRMIKQKSGDGGLRKQESFPNTSLGWAPEGSRRRKRLMVIWGRIALKQLKTKNVNRWSEASVMARDVVVWRSKEEMIVLQDATRRSADPVKYKSAGVQSCCSIGRMLCKWRQLVIECGLQRQCSSCVVAYKESVSALWWLPKTVQRQQWVTVCMHIVGCCKLAMVNWSWDYWHAKNIVRAVFLFVDKSYSATTIIALVNVKGNLIY